MNLKSANQLNYLHLENEHSTRYREETPSKKCHEYGLKDV